MIWLGALKDPSKAVVGELTPWRQEGIDYHGLASHNPLLYDIKGPEEMREEAEQRRALERQRLFEHFSERQEIRRKFFGILKAIIDESSQRDEHGEVDTLETSDIEDDAEMDDSEAEIQKAKDALAKEDIPPTRKSH